MKTIFLKTVLFFGMFMSLGFFSQRAQAAIDYQSIPVKTWTRVNDGATGPPTSKLAYSGGAIDLTNRKFWIFGGGHQDSGDNSIWSWNLDTGVWSSELAHDQVMLDMSTTFCQANVDNINYPGKWIPSGNPISRHTYYSNVFIPSLNKLFTAGGVNWSGPTSGPAGNNNLSDSFPNGDGSSCYASSPGDQWLFDPVSKTWTYQGFGPGHNDYDNSRTRPSIPRELVYASDLGKLILVEYVGGFKTVVWTSDNAGATWSQRKVISYTGDPDGTFYLEEFAITYDSKRQRVVIFGGGSSTLRYYDWATNVWVAPVTTGSKPTGAVDSGMVYDSVDDVYIVLENNGKLWTFDPNTNTWTPDQGPVTTETMPTQSNGSQPNVFNRLQYDPVNNVVLYVTMATTYKSEVWAYRYVSTPADTTAPSAPSGLSVM